VQFRRVLGAGAGARQVDRHRDVKEILGDKALRVCRRVDRLREIDPDKVRRPGRRFERLLQQRRLMPPGWFAIPGNGARLDRFGNMRGSQIVEILSALQAFNLSGFSANRTTRSIKRNKRLRKYFAITGNNRRASNGGNLPMGIYEQKRDKSIVTVLRFRPTVHYERRLHWFAIADEVMSKHKDADIRGGIRKALRQARGHAALAA
jgi:hypothetical protein